MNLKYTSSQGPAQGWVGQRCLQSGSAAQQSTVVLRLECTPSSARRLVKIQRAVPLYEFLTQEVWWGLNICISTMSAGDANGAGPETTLRLMDSS